MKKHYIISDSGSIIGFTKEDYEMLPEKSRKLFEELGNHFETKKEARQAVERLKAWKRLKDKGFSFKGYDDYNIDYELTGRCVWTDETEKDLDLLFGGEE